MAFSTLRLPQAKKRVPVFGTRGRKTKRTIPLPTAFAAPRRPDLVRKAVIFLQSKRFQPKGSSKLSGHKYSVEGLGAGYGIARVSRIKGEGTQKSRGGGFIPFAVGGRPTHPPKPEKVLVKILNKKERRLALLSAIAMTADLDVVRSRGHAAPGKLTVPLAVTDSVRRLDKTSKVKNLLVSLGLEKELKRCQLKSIRPGVGKMRGRKYKKRVGPLIVVEKDEGIGKAASNIAGVDVTSLRKLNVEHLAPGGHPGRLVLWSASALRKIDRAFLRGLE